MAEALHRVFIDVEVDDSVAADAELAAKLEEVCPVDIFKADATAGVEIVEENLDECVLCKLCIEAAPAGHGARQEALRRHRAGSPAAKPLGRSEKAAHRPEKPLAACARVKVECRDPIRVQGDRA